MVWPDKKLRCISCLGLQHKSYKIKLKIFQSGHRTYYDCLKLSGNQLQRSWRGLATPALFVLTGTLEHFLTLLASISTDRGVHCSPCQGKQDHTCPVCLDRCLRSLHASIASMPLFPLLPVLPQVEVFTLSRQTWPHLPCLS